MVELNPTHEVRDGLDVVWQIPPNSKAILYIGHSANVSPLSYWPPTTSAPNCTGTVEHKVFVKKALERGYAVIAGDSITSEWDAWPTTKQDVQNTVKLLKEWRSEHAFEDLPLCGLGTSIGGDYMTSLATVVKMKAVVIMISKGKAEALESAVAGEYPPVLWLPMIKDERTFSQVRENDRALRAKGILSAIVEAPPLEVHPHFFAEHIDEIDKEQSSKLHSVFLEHGIVAEDNSLKKVLMGHDVEPCLRKAGILPAGDDAQRHKDQEKLHGLKTGESAGSGPGRGSPPHEGPPHGGPVGRGGRGPPRGGRVGGQGGPPPPEGGIGGGPRAGPPPPIGGRGGGPGRGPPGGGPPGRKPPRPNPIADGVSNQLRVAEGKHTLTARHCDAIFDWFEGKGWPKV